MIESKVVFC